MTAVERSAPGERYRFMRALGEGGMGAVDLVWDAVREQAVARKRCLVDSAAPSAHGPTQRAFTRLKQEFRALAELRHPSLVAMYELSDDGGGVSFTMEAVDGVDLFTHCRLGSTTLDAPTHDEGASDCDPSMSATFIAGGDDTRVGSGVAPTTIRTHLGDRAYAATMRSDPGLRRDRPAGTCSFERLATVLPSMLEGLAYLHAHGLVHRDLKPSNVLVTRDGAAKVLDFGIIAELSSRSKEIVGTLAYMAPEQFAAARPTAAMDLYALGITLFEIVTGDVPFHAPHPVALMRCHLMDTPPRLRSVVPDTPLALDEAVAALLAKDPEARPSIESLVRTLLPALGARPARMTNIARGALVGREALVAELAEALRGTAPALVLRAPSGVGKSALADAAARDALARGVRVFRGRARRNELVAFNALDRIVDEVAQLLSEGDHAGLDQHRRRAAVVFPAIGRGLEGALDPSTTRSLGFDGLIQLLGAIARDSSGLVLLVDDLQWADTDSLSFLAELVGVRPSGVQLLATLRSDLPSSAASAWMASLADLRCIDVPALGQRELATIVMRSAGRDLPEETVERLALGCAGRAYLAEVAGRLATESETLPTDLAAALAQKLQASTDDARALLGTLAAANGWIGASEVAAATGIPLGRVDETARELGALAIVRLTGTLGHDAQLDLYHDVAREAALVAVGAVGLRRAHAGIVDALERAPDADPLRLVRHLEGAGRLVDAARRAIREAGRAEARRAYGLAADLYAIAAEGLPEEASSLRRARVTAFLRGGRYDEAIEAIDALVPTDDADRARLAFDRAYALLTSGAVVEGRRALDGALRLAGSRPLAMTHLAFIPDALRFILGPPRFPRTSEAGVAIHTRERREREAEIALLLSWEEPLDAIGWAQRVRMRGDRERHPERGAFADYVLSFLALASSPSVGEVPLAARYLASARARAATLAGDPYLSALEATTTAFRHFRLGQFSLARDLYDDTIRSLEEAGYARTHLHMLTLSHRCGCAMAGEDLADLARAIDAFEAACPAHQGAMEAHTLVHRLVVALYRGQRDEFERCVTRMNERKVADGHPRFHHLVNEMFVGYGRLVFGDPLDVREDFARALREARAFAPMRSYVAGCFASLCSLAEVSALRAGDERASRRAIRRYEAIARRSPPLFTSCALRASAYAADHEGATGRALALLSEAETLAERQGQMTSVAIARYQRGLRIGGPEGDALIARAREDIAARGVASHVLAEDPGRR